jgi:hypothetical protein
MDITEGSEQRRQLGIQRFLAGDALAFEGVTFWKDRNQFLVISSFSEFVHPESSSPEEAASKIARSKDVLAKLSTMYPEFSQVAASMPHKYEFCRDYGKGAIMLASLEAEKIVWRG